MRNAEIFGGTMPRGGLLDVALVPLGGPVGGFVPTPGVRLGLCRATSELDCVAAMVISSATAHLRILHNSTHVLVAMSSQDSEFEC